MALHLERPHHLDKEAAREQVAEVVEEIAPMIKAGYHWEGDRMTFKGRGVRGAIEVDDRMVRVEVVRSPLLPVSERWLRKQIEERLDAHFPPPERRPPPDGGKPSTDAISEPEPSPHVSSPDASDESNAKKETPKDTASDEGRVTRLITPLVDLAEDTAQNALRIASVVSKASFHIAREVLRSDHEPGLDDTKE